MVNLGSLCIDHVYRVPHVAAGGETLASTRHQIFPGGKGLNQSMAARKAGADVVHVGCIGADGGFLVDLLEEQGVSVQGIRVVVDEPSGHAVIQVTDAGSNAIVIAGGANRCLTEADIDASLSQLLPGDWLLLQNEINQVATVLERAAAQGARIAFNVAPVDGRESGYDFSGVDLLIVNEVESRALLSPTAPAAHQTDDETVARALAARLPQTDVVLTRGANGLIHVKGDRVMKMGAFSVTAIDETAAGDAFIGYLMAALLDGEPYERALAMSSAAGALAVTREGAASSIPERAEVMAYLDCHSASQPVPDRNA